jgi:MFS transporter, UMF1 family
LKSVNIRCHINGKWDEGKRLEVSSKKRIWGWFFFDWASQPYNTLLITFIFGPYINEIMGDGVAAQAAWGYGIGAAGIIIAVLAPILGAIADTSGSRMKWIWVFSILYVIGSAGLWLAVPQDFNLLMILTFFAIGLIGMELATIFTNSMLPDLGSREDIGRISGNGWAFGYVGGFVTLVVMLVFFAESSETGKTFVGFSPAFGLDADTREGTRFVGPLTALWYAVFMVPFFLWVREPKAIKAPKGAVSIALKTLRNTLKSLPSRPSLFAYLASSMSYRDALNGLYAFGGIYASGVLGWTVPEVGIFGIIAIIAGAIFAWLGGRADWKYGPKPVIRGSIILLILVCIAFPSISPTMVLWLPVDELSAWPDISFYILGAVVGAAGGVIQSASRTMMVRQANPERMTEAFGLYALAGKATSFVAPLAIGLSTQLSGSQQWGIVPLILMFAVGLFLMRYVDANPKSGD